MITAPAPFVVEMPPFVRMVWTSARAESVWAPRLERIRVAWPQIERWAVVAGHRPAALLTVEPRDVGGVTRWAVANGVRAFLFDEVEPTSLLMADGPARTSTGARWQQRVVVTRDQGHLDWMHAVSDAAIGTLLGYPGCCQTAYLATHRAGLLDPMHGGALGPAATNMFLRPLGVRLCPHVPCAPTCEPSLVLAGQLLSCAMAHGYGEEADWIAEMLEWPMEWSALHGIAEVKTPVFKVAYRTDDTATKVVARRTGTRYPEEGATGVTFPYRAPAHVVSLASLRKTAPSIEETRAKENGFASAAVQARMHEMVLACLRDSPPTLGAVLDLGCGNGALLQRIAAEFPGTPIVGIERDASKVREPWVVVDDLRSLMSTPLWAKADTIIVAQRRFAEVPGLEAWVRSQCRQVLLYSYDTPLVFARLEFP